MNDQIERELLLGAEPTDVWEAVTAPGFLAEDVQLELYPGGEARFGSGDEVKTGWIEEAVAPGVDGDCGGLLVFWWSADDEPASRVELTLEPAGERATRLRVIESRPLEVLDAIGIPLPGRGSSAHGPAMLAAV